MKENSKREDFKGKMVHKKTPKTEEKTVFYSENEIDGLRMISSLCCATNEQQTVGGLVCALKRLSSKGEISDSKKTHVRKKERKKERKRERERERERDRERHRRWNNIQYM